MLSVMFGGLGVKALRRRPMLERRRPDAIKYGRALTVTMCSLDVDDGVIWELETLTSSFHACAAPVALQQPDSKRCCNLGHFGSCFCSPCDTPFVDAWVGIYCTCTIVSPGCAGPPSLSTSIIQLRTKSSAVGLCILLVLPQREQHSPQLLV